jgi:hypothetical protein
MEKRLNPGHSTGLETSPGLQCEAWRPRLGHSLAARSSRGGGPWRGSGARAPDALATWSPRGGHALGGGVVRLVHVLQQTRCPGKGGTSTVGAVAMRLMRWRQRWLTRAVARHARAARRRRGDVPRWQRHSGDG